MNLLIQNQYLKAQISSKGAELQTLVSKDTALNYIWFGDDKFWAKHSPVLFPIVGALKDDTYYFKGEKYHLPRHGFARDMEFSAHQISETEIEFCLEFNEETLVKYPFKFRLYICYILTGRTLKCTYKVENLGKEIMCFSLGAHPAFAVPLNNERVYDDYALVFQEDDELISYQITNNLLTDESRKIPLEDRSLKLSHHLFLDDALVFKNLKSKNIQLKSHLHSEFLEFEYENFPYFGVWAALNADFVCLEPWQGIADHVNHNQDIETKEGMLKLSPHDSWQANWQITCH